MTEFNDELMSFIARSRTPYHAVATMAERLSENGFMELKESSVWDLAPGRYFVTRNQSSIIGFVVGTSDPCDTGIRIVGAHTDSPCLKVKPNPISVNREYVRLGVEVYGGVLLNPWYDRDLGLAGRVTCREGSVLRNRLLDFDRAVAIIPSLAIHLDRGVNDARSINPQTDIPPVLMHGDEEVAIEEILTDQLRCEYGDDWAGTILGYELSFYDVNPPAIVGLNSEFIAAARLDNLLSCFVGMKSLIESSGNATALLVCNDHEEVGSNSAVGAAGPFLKSVLERIVPVQETRHRIIDRSLLISTDNAHGIHPNYADRHDGNHGPLLNQGPVIKINSNQRYATNSETAAYFANLCETRDIPYQKFVNRTDMGCGSTIGPITAKEIGIKTMDVGVPTFAMHSIRELAGTQDAHLLHRALNGFYDDPGAPGAEA